LIRNFSHKEARFDSRSEPLFRLFKLLPFAIECLVQLSADPDWDTRQFPISLLKKFGGLEGYDRLVSAAVVADGMVTFQKFINLSQVFRGGCWASATRPTWHPQELAMRAAVCPTHAACRFGRDLGGFADRWCLFPQVADDDSAVEGKQCAELLAIFRCLFLEGGIWLHEAEGTLTHSVLAAIKDRAVFFGRPGDEKLITMGWPAPESVSRAGPIAKAKRFFELVDAFMQSHFPGYETGQMYGVFDLSSKSLVPERAEVLRCSVRTCTAVLVYFPGSVHARFASCRVAV